MSFLIHQFIAQHAATAPSSAALLFKDRVIGYAELQREVSAVARGLLALGLGPGERVAAYLPKQPETFVDPAVF